MSRMPNVALRALSWGEARRAQPGAAALAWQQGPSRRWQLANFVVTQAAWFAAVLGAARGRPEWGVIPTLLGIAWHLAIVRSGRLEAALVLVVAVVGLVAETLVLQLGHVAYTSGQWHPALPPYWLVGLWGLFATSLNVTMRWLRGRVWLTALLGAVAGPAAFSSGVRLGGARFVDPNAALVTLVIEWAVLMPLLMALAQRLDGVAPMQERRHV
jgi:hypothetical protein